MCPLVQNFIEQLYFQLWFIDQNVGNYETYTIVNFIKMIMLIWICKIIREEKESHICTVRVVKWEKKT